MNFITIRESRRETVHPGSWIWYSADNMIDRLINTDKIIDVLNDDETKNIYNVFYIIYDSYIGITKIMCFGNIQEFSKLIQTGGILEGRYNHYINVINNENK